MAEEEEEGIRSPGRAHAPHNPMVPAGPHGSGVRSTRGVYVRTGPDFGVEPSPPPRIPIHRKVIRRQGRGLVHPKCTLNKDPPPPAGCDQ